MSIAKWAAVANRLTRCHHFTMRVHAPLVFLAAAIGACGQPARACSVVSGYKVPDTLELVEQSDAIVLARVEKGGIDPDFGIRRARLKPIALLKGKQLPREIEFERTSISTNRWKAIASDPRNLADPNPDVYSGGCNRLVFDNGMIVVAFLKEVDGHFIVNAPPFSRALEDVPSADALWVKAVRLYVEIAALPPAQRQEKMRRERDFLSTEIDDPDARLLAHELDRALALR